MSVVGVKIDSNNKLLYYNSNGLKLKRNLTVVIEDERGLQFGKVVSFVEDRDNKKYDSVIRIATKRDYNQYLKNITDAKNAITKCKRLISDMGLNMSIIDNYYNLDKSLLLFRFVSDERVDFRELARELGSKLKTRIEFRQIGIRDKAREVGGIGPCGRFLCCSTFLTDFDTVSINMAKNQGLALNPTKINGVCGRLLCCLTYENDIYTQMKKEKNTGDKDDSKKQTS